MAQTTPDANASGPPTRTPAAHKVQRPVGTLVLAAVLLITGAWVGVQLVGRVTSFVSATGMVVVHASVYVAMTRDAVTAATALLGAVGLLAGRSFGWWLSLMHVVWRLAIHGVLPLVGAFVAQTEPDPARLVADVGSAMVTSALFFGIAIYLQKKNVRAFFRVRVCGTAAI